jgi:hypothetical protein
VVSLIGFCSDVQALATGYFEAINSDKLQLVDVVKRGEKLSDKTNEILGTEKGTKGELIDEGWGGGRTYSKGGSNPTLSIIVTDAKTKATDYVDSKGKVTSRASSPGELMAHEVVGHGLGYWKSSPTFHHEDAIQSTNLFLRISGSGTYRNGSDHNNKPTLSKSTANGVPAYLKKK